MKPLLTLHDPATAQRHYAEGLWADDTLYTLLARHASERPDAWAFRDAARRITWAEAKRWTDAVAARLAAAGIVAGERVSLWLSNRLETVIAVLACARQGYVCNPSLHRNYTVAEIVALLERIGAVGLIAETAYGADADRHDVFAAAAALPELRALWRVPPGHTPGADFPAVDAGGDPGPALRNADAVCYLAFTSGTTGRPKGVMHSANTLLANPRDMVRDWGHGPATTILSLSPLSHHIAWVAVGQALLAGAELAVNDPPPGTGLLDWIVETGASYVMGVPTHAMDVLAEQRRRGLDRLGRVSVFYMAGAPIPRATAQAFLAQGIRPQNVYGMTENSSHQYTLPDDEPETVVATCGRACRSYEVRLFRPDAPEVEVPQGEVGHIGGRGACLMLGYFDDQKATEGSFNRTGWFLSGDLGRFDENGCLAIVGRLKDIVIRGGHNIHPARIEDLALKHAHVAKAAAFGIADERLGEKVCLAIIPAGAAPGPGALLDHLYEAGLSKYDMPEYVVALDAFPLTPSGKILKRELVEMAKRGAFRPEPVRWTEPAKRRA